MTNTVRFPLLYVESKKRKENKFIDTEYRLLVTRGRGGGMGEMGKESQKVRKQINE